MGAALWLPAAATVLPTVPEPLPVHGMALHGDLRYPADFEHFDYADPEAPKGGTVRLAGNGTFDSLNPFILRGTAPQGIQQVFDTLTVQSADEPFSVYGLIAEWMRIPEDRSWVEFKLREEAEFHDGSPITVEDVIFSLKRLREEGHPFYRSYYRDVANAERTGPRRVRFHFAEPGNMELPLILGQLPVLSKDYWADREFARTTMTPPLGSGPYRIASVRPGRSVTYERVPEYWARDLPVRRGHHNFDRIRYDYYRDGTVALEAFKAGEVDLREENVARNWAMAYDVPAVARGLIRKETIEHDEPTGMQGFLFNTRRPIFEDRRVRQALSYAFDYEWTNKYLFYGTYTRTRSYFSNSELAAEGPPSEAEREILAPYADELPEGLLDEPFEPPETDGSGWGVRHNLLRAHELLADAGWSLRDGVLVHDESGRPLRFELLLVNPTFERIALPFIRNLERIGVQARARTVDTTQYQYRLQNFEFDMAVMVLPQSLSPGHEQRDYWTSSAAERPGSRNYMGIRNPVVDDLVDQIVAAESRAELVNRTRALDRVLLWNHYVIPQWHVQSYRIAYWDKFGRPDTSPRYDLGLDTWWVDPAKEARLRRTGEAPRSTAPEPDDRGASERQGR